MKPLYSVMASVAVLLFCQCTKDEPDTMETGPLPTVVSYSVHIKPIIDNRCISCHSGASPAANLLLTTYEEVAEGALNRGLLDRIARPIGDPLLMPNSGEQLSEFNIKLITKWQLDGLPQ
jgi:hypothetical protein